LKPQNRGAVSTACCNQIERKTIPIYCRRFRSGRPGSRTGRPQASRSPNWQCGRRRRSSAGQLRPPDRHARSRASRPARPEATYRNGRRPDFAKKPLVSLLAFCFAFGDGPYRVTLALTQTRACRRPTCPAGLFSTRSTARALRSRTACFVVTPLIPTTSI
jgi:hypothetical protein